MNTFNAIQNITATEAIELLSKGCDFELSGADRETAVALLESLPVSRTIQDFCVSAVETLPEFANAIGHHFLCGQKY